MKLFLFCTLIAIPDLVRSLDVQCTLDVASFHDGIGNDNSCVLNGPLTVKTGETLNIVSENNLNSIGKITFSKGEEDRAQISTVPSEIFEQIPNLKILILHATVEVLRKGDFEKAGKLKDLTVGNQIKTIPAGVLGSAKNLESLILSDNKIAEIEDNAFNGLNALFSIDLGNNNLTIIKQNTFNGLENLQMLDLQSNQIESIEENALNLPSLQILRVTDNKLTSLSDNLFLATPLLQVFNAINNQINHIGKSLYELKNLKELYLSDNKLADVDLLAFSQMPFLKELFVNKNRLTSEIFRNIEIKEPSKSVLTYLSLDRNELTNKDDLKKFAIFPQLREIDVQNNKYSKIDIGDDKTLRQQFPRLTKVYASSGEWNCDWLQNFVESSKRDGINIIGSEFFDTNGKKVNGIGCV